MKGNERIASMLAAPGNPAVLAYSLPEAKTAMPPSMGPLGDPALWVK